MVNVLTSGKTLREFSFCIFMGKEILILDHYPAESPMYDELGLNGPEYIQYARHRLRRFSDRLLGGDVSITFMRPSEVSPEVLQRELDQQYTLVIGSGSPWNINRADIQENPWIEEEMKMLQTFFHKKQGKYFGTCFGHQIWHAANGGQVEPAAAYHHGPSTLTELSSGKSCSVHRSHGHHVIKPAPDSIVTSIGSGKDTGQKIIYGTVFPNAFTTQAHPEADVFGRQIPDEYISHIREHLFSAAHS